MKPNAAFDVFISYSHRDEELRAALETHLALLKRERSIRTWHDRRIDAGREWQGEIDRHLDSADLVLLLISPDFIASDVHDRSRRERFFRGARKMAKLQHEGIVRVIEPELEDGGYHFFVMELAGGGDLRRAVLDGHVTGLEILRDVARALDFAHRARPAPACRPPAFCRHLPAICRHGSRHSGGAEGSPLQGAWPL